MGKIRRTALIGVIAAGLIGGAAFGWVNPQAPDEPTTSNSITENTPQSEQPENVAPRQGEEPALRLEWTPPSEVRVNRPAPYKLTVTNTGTQAVMKAVVQVRIPGGATTTDTSPAVKTIGGVLMWELGTVEPRETHELTMHLSSPVRGELSPQAWVTFTGTAATTVIVKEPKLQAFITVPETIEIGRDIPIAYGVKNTGDCTAENVTFRLEAGDGGNRATLSEGTSKPEDLSAGESFNRELKQGAGGAGTMNYTVIATTADGLTNSATARVTVLAPKLVVQASGPSEIRLTKSAEYIVTVSNTGNVPARDVCVTTDLGPAVQYRRGLLPETVPEEHVQIGDLAPGEKKTLTIAGIGMKPGNGVLKVTATDDHGLTANAECRTVVRGIPGIRMEVVDSLDPVKTDGDVMYTITVMNTGTEPDHNLVVNCDLPAGMTLVSAAGPVEYQARYGIEFAGGDLNPQNSCTVTFNPVRTLGPKTEVVFKVKVKPEKPGISRFTASITSDHLTKPVTKEESTTVYGK